MKNRYLALSPAAAIAGVAAFGAAAPAEARVFMRVGVGPGYYGYGPRNYPYASPYYAPPPVVYSPPPYSYAPPPVYSQPVYGYNPHYPNY